ncbi:MAG: hypothetical protein IKJ32_00435 [Clostridia bacterium]|nr:hypothetical protein [Clostridia bacterium]
MKSQRGISALSLMITIVIIIMIAGYSLLFSRDTVVEGNVATIYAEVQEVVEAAKGLSLDREYAKDALTGFELESVADINHRVGGKLNSAKQYYYWGYADENMTEVMAQTLNDKIGLRSVSNSYVVAINDLGKVEVYLVDGININGTMCYTYDEIYAQYTEVNKK